LVFYATKIRNNREKESNEIKKYGVEAKN
jgi:hypothetical protein